MASDPYTQCKLRHEDGRIDYAWIPKGLAQKNKSLKLKTDEGWEGGWSVEEVWATSSLEWLQRRSQDYKKQRDFSDI